MRYAVAARVAVVAAALIALATVLFAQTQFPRDEAAHAQITANFIGMERPDAALLVSTYVDMVDSLGQVVVVCAYGHAVEKFEGVGVVIESLVYEPVMAASGPACDERAVGFFILVPQAAWMMGRASLTELVDRIVSSRPDMVFGAIMHDVARRDDYAVPDLLWVLYGASSEPSGVKRET